MERPAAMWGRGRRGGRPWSLPLRQGQERRAAAGERCSCPSRGGLVGASPCSQRSTTTALTGGRCSARRPVLGRNCLRASLLCAAVATQPRPRPEHSEWRGSGMDTDGDVYVVLDAGCRSRCTPPGQSPSATRRSCAGRRPGRAAIRSSRARSRCGAIAGARVAVHRPGRGGYQRGDEGPGGRAGGGTAAGQTSDRGAGPARRPVVTALAAAQRGLGPPVATPVEAIDGIPSPPPASPSDLGRDLRCGSVGFGSGRCGVTYPRTRVMTCADGLSGVTYP